MEQSCQESNPLTSLQMGLLRRYSRLANPQSPGYELPGYLQYTAPPERHNNVSGGENKTPAVLPITSVELNPLFGAFQPYTPLVFPQDSPSEYKSRRAATAIVHPLLMGTSCHYQRRIRGEKKAIPDEQKDDRYFERRKRNNQAAKKSRDARKLREDQVALRAAILEHENAMMRAQIITLREETQALRGMLLLTKKSADDRTQLKATETISPALLLPSINASFLKPPVIVPLNRKNSAIDAPIAHNL